MARPYSYRPAKDRLIVDACLPRGERLRRPAAELGRSPDALAKLGARVIASRVADTTGPGDPWNAIRRAALEALEALGADVPPAAATAARNGEAQRAMLATARAHVEQAEHEARATLHGLGREAQR